MTDLGVELEAVRRRRTAAAFVLITASLSVGILVGRMSASFVPAESPGPSASAGQTSQPPKPVLTAAQPAPVAQPPAQPPAPAQQTAAAQPPKLEITKDLAAGNAAVSPTTQVAAAAVGESPPPSADGTAGASDTKTPDSGVAVINPGGGSEGVREPNRSRPASERRGADDRMAAAEAGSPDARSSGLEKCERRYSSFRREDGTYQPYDGGPRLRCPHLR